MKILNSFFAAFLLLMIFAACEAEVLKPAESDALPTAEKMYTALWYNEAGDDLAILEQHDIPDIALAAYDLDMPALGLELDVNTHAEVIEDLFGQGAIESIKTRAGDGFVIRNEIGSNLLDLPKYMTGCSDDEIAEYCNTAMEDWGGQCIGGELTFIPGWCIILHRGKTCYGYAVACSAL